MFEITSITNAPRQTMQIPLDGGDSVTFRIHYYPTQYSWYFDFEYKDYVCNGSRVVLSPNVLRYLKNLIPFGISFVCDSDVEPYSIEDFSTGRIKMYILNAQEVQDVEEQIFNVE